MAGEETHNVAFEEEKESLLALTQEVLRKPRVDRTRAQDLTTFVLKNFAPAMAVAERIFQPDKIGEIKAIYSGLERKEKVYYASALDAQIPWNTEQKKRHQELNLLNRGHDVYLFTWAWAHFQKDPVLKPILLDIRKGSGSRDDAEDIVREVRIFRDRLATLENRTPVTVAYLDQAEKDATEQLALFGLKDLDRTGSPLDLRRRAYTVWEIAYNQLAHEGRYLTGDTPEAMTLFPRISAVREASDVPEPSAPAPDAPA